ncbi:unnamed protein product [Diatraea saccharalis]|uniref:Uncharacterized protein n=1 Tax=Diatraea saccharalis TaxID=40085 RepID=A0A9N9WER4_9NEOP|nr:unnamed protein product [Diatraea saccharalis]
MLLTSIDLEDRLRYIAVKPNASIFALRQKIWHLLDLPDYCEEVIVLKTTDGKEIPLTQLRKGNHPHHPYILEVWMPEARPQLTIMRNMLTLGNGESIINSSVTSVREEKELGDNAISAANENVPVSCAVSKETMPANNFPFSDKKCLNLLKTDYKSDITCQISSTSVFKLGRRNRDSFTNILLKIQSDLCTLSNKLSNLENRIPV